MFLVFTFTITINVRDVVSDVMEIFLLRSYEKISHEQL